MKSLMFICIKVSVLPTNLYKHPPIYQVQSQNQKRLRNKDQAHNPPTCPDNNLSSYRFSFRFPVKEHGLSNPEYYGRPFLESNRTQKNLPYKRDENDESIHIRDDRHAYASDYQEVLLHDSLKFQPSLLQSCLPIPLS